MNYTLDTNNLNNEQNSPAADYNGLQQQIQDIRNTISRQMAENAQTQEYTADNKDSDKKYRLAFTDYLRTGSENALNHLEKNNEQSNKISKKDGGYPVSRSMSETIHGKIQDISTIRNITKIIKTRRNSVEASSISENLLTGWSNEGLSAIENNNTIQMSKVVIPVYDLYAQPKASQKLIDDPEIDIENLLSEKLARAFAEKEEEAYLYGDGVEKPRGIFSYMEQIMQINHGSLNYDSLSQLYYSLPNKYLNNAKFLVSRKAAQEILKLVHENALPNWNSNSNNQAGLSIFGCEVVVSHMIKENSKCQVLFGDFEQAYWIVDSLLDTRILRDPFTQKSVVQYFSTKSSGGALVEPKALSALVIN